MALCPKKNAPGTEGVYLRLTDTTEIVRLSRLLPSVPVPDGIQAVSLLRETLMTPHSLRVSLPETPVYHIPVKIVQTIFG